MDLNRAFRKRIYEAHPRLPVRFTPPHDPGSYVDSLLETWQLDPKVYLTLFFERTNRLKRHAFVAQVQDNASVARANVQIHYGAYALARMEPTFARRNRVIHVNLHSCVALG